MAKQAEIMVRFEAGVLTEPPREGRSQKLTFEQAMQRLTEALEITKADIALTLELGKPVITGKSKRT